MKRVNIIFVGGFCGAGKTTSIIAIAKYFADIGKRIGIITNEPGDIVIDSEQVKAHGFNATEITGDCFSNNNHKFVEKISELCKKEDIDYILAEPAGSCTDLGATLMKPVRNGNRGYKILPLSVLIDPIRLLTEIVSTNKHLPKEIEYLMIKQMEEADILIVNKADILSRVEKEKIEAYLYEKFTGRKIIFISAKRSIGIEEWMMEVERLGLSYHIRSKRNLNINYETYTKAVTSISFLELNCGLTLRRKISGNYLMSMIAEAIKRNLRDENYELVHLKMRIKGNQGYSKLGCTSSYSRSNIDKKLDIQIENGILIIQIRAAIHADRLHEIIELVIDNILLRNYHAEIENKTMECFPLPLPKPVYRY